MEMDEEVEKRRAKKRAACVCVPSLQLTLIVILSSRAVSTDNSVMGWDLR